MQGNPFKAFTPLYPEPEKLKASQLLSHDSLEMNKIRQSIRNYKGSLLYIAGTLGVFAVMSIIASQDAKKKVIGNGNGGTFLNLYSIKSTADLAYNREFQRMRYLTESTVPNEPVHNEAFLKDAGIQLERYGANPNIHKKAPHPKYY